MAAIVCLAIAVREVWLRGARTIEPLLGLLVVVVAANAFYIFSMLADIKFNAGGNIALVNQRFNIGTFLHYATNVGIFNTVRLQSFYYTSIARQPFVVVLGCAVLPLLLLGLLLLVRRPALRSPFYLGLAFALFEELWLVDGIAIAPAAYTWFHIAVPGMRSFVEPDYFSPLFIFGAFVMLAASIRVGVRAYGGACRVAVWILALAGIVPFLPVAGGASGMPQTGQPRQYRAFSQAHVQGNTLWLPPNRGVQYRWSPYTINGFTSLNSPSDALGPAMAEAVAPGTLRVQSRLAGAFLGVQTKTARALAPLLGVGTIAIAADSYSPDLQWPDPEVTSSLETLRLLQRSGFITARSDDVDVNVDLVTATTRPPQPEIGVYDEPVDAGGYDNFMWRSVLAPSAQYSPVMQPISRRRTAPGDVRATFRGSRAADDLAARDSGLGVPRLRASAAPPSGYRDVAVRADLSRTALLLAAAAEPRTRCCAASRARRAAGWSRADPNRFLARPAGCGVARSSTAGARGAGRNAVGASHGARSAIQHCHAARCDGALGFATRCVSDLPSANLRGVAGRVEQAEPARIHGGRDDSRPLHGRLPAVVRADLAVAARARKRLGLGPRAGRRLRERVDRSAVRVR